MLGLLVAVFGQGGGKYLVLLLLVVGSRCVPRGTMARWQSESQKNPRISNAGVSPWFHVKLIMCGLRFANFALLRIPFQYFSLEPGLVGHIHSEHSGVSKFSRAIQLCFTPNGVKVILVM